MNSPDQTDPTAAGTYDILISYSRENVEFASKLESLLRAYRPPAGLGLPKRRLRVFRDQSDIAGPEYKSAIGKALGAADKLVVLCSPAARASTYVDDEIERFVRLGAEKKIVSVLIAGVPNNETKEGDEADAAFPEALCRALEIPLAIDYREVDLKKQRLDRGVCYAAWYTLLAQIYGVTRAAIERRDLRRRRRQRLTATAVVSVVIAALAALAVWALTERAEAERQRDVAVARLLANQASAIDALDLEQRQQKALLAIEALKRFARRGEISMEADRALRTALGLFARRTDKLELEQDPRDLRFSRPGDVLVATDEYGKFYRFAFPIDDTPPETWKPPAHGPQVVNAHGTHVAVSVGPSGTSRTVRVFAVGDRDGEPRDGYRSREVVELGAEGRLLAVDGKEEYETLLLDVATGAEIARFPGPGKLEFSPDGRHLAVASRRPQARGLDWLKTDLEVLRIVGSPIASLETIWSSDGYPQFSADGRFVTRGTSEIFETESGKEIGSLTGPSDGRTYGHALGPNARFVAYFGSTRGVEVRDVKSGDGVRIAGLSEDFSWHPGGRIFSIAESGSSYRKHVAIWEIVSLSEALEVLHALPVHKLRIVSDPPTLVTITRGEGEDGGWASEARSLTQGFPKARDDLEFGAGDGWISTDGRHIAFHAEGSADFYDAVEGLLLRSVRFDDVLSAVVFEQRGPHVALDDGEQVRVVDLDTGTVRATLAYTGNATEIRLEPDGWWLFTEKPVLIGEGTRGERTTVEPTRWDLKTGESTTSFVHAYRDRERPFESSKRKDGAISITRTADQREIARIELGTEVDLLALSDDGKYLVGRVGEHAVRIWFLDPDRVTERACEMLAKQGIGKKIWNRLIPFESYRPTCAP